MIFHIISNNETKQGRKFSAYGLFSSAPEQFSALLENPNAEGRQFLVSKQGDTAALQQQDSAQAADAFFKQWRVALQSHHSNSPTIRCLIYAAYEAAERIESLPAPKTEVPGPVLWTLYPEFSFCFDNETIHIAARTNHALLTALALLHASAMQEPDIHPFSASHPIATAASTLYKDAVRCVKAYIGAGDVFQANIARFWSMPFNRCDLTALYDQLRRVNPAPFSSLVTISTGSKSLHLISASPERLFRLHRNGDVDARPIAGTRRRAEGEQDDCLKAELLLSEKERAEHIMLVDLERNDLGRVCKPGSVEVNERMVIEQYATVQHIVSNVRGQLEEGYDVIDLFKAMFPGGTITGCPKVRCMEIIHELEHNARGPYTGGLGYVAWDGSADMNILIRTFWHYAGQLHWAAGAGIVADSDPEHELIETEHKAEGLLRALFYKH